MPIIHNLDVMLAKRKMSLTDLSEDTGITFPQLSKLKKGLAKSIRYEDMDKICSPYLPTR
jgi:putative transcriptional regulator